MKCGGADGSEAAPRVSRLWECERWIFSAIEQWAIVICDRWTTSDFENESEIEEEGNEWRNEWYW
jgi:thymidylate kinase